MSDEPRTKWELVDENVADTHKAFLKRIRGIILRDDFRKVMDAYKAKREAVAAACAEQERTGRPRAWIPNTDPHWDFKKVESDYKHNKVKTTTRTFLTEGEAAAFHEGVSFVNDSALVTIHNGCSVIIADQDDTRDAIPSDAHMHDDPRHDSRIAESEGWALIDVDSSGLLEIEKDDNDPEEIFDSDAAAEAYVRAVAALGCGAI